MVALGHLEADAFAGQRAIDVGLQLPPVLTAVHLAQGLAEHAVAGPAVPLLVDLVGELVGEIGRHVGDQRRHMVGDQADPALALAQRLGMTVALGDIGKGIDETAGGQWVRTNLQYPTIEQPLFQFANRPAAGVTAVGREQGQLAVGHDFLERSMRLDRRQPAELEEASVPQLQRAFGADHRHALGQVVHRPLQQPRLLRQRLLAAHGLADLHLGDIGVENHQPAFAGRPLADLHPATVVQSVHRGFVALATVLLHDEAGAFGHAPHLGQARAGIDARAGACPKRFEAAVEQHDALIAVEQHEGVGDALDGVHQMLVSGFRAQAGIAEQLVAALEFSHRLIQGIGALAHLLGQFHRVLEGRVGGIAAGTAGFHTLDQCRIDALELVVFPFEFGLPRQQLSDSPVLPVGQWRHR